MGDSLDGSGEPSPESQNVAVIEFTAFASYLRKAVTVLLPDEDVIPPAFNMALEERYHQDCIRKFLGDSQVSSLYVQRSSTKGKRNVPASQVRAVSPGGQRSFPSPVSPLPFDMFDNRATLYTLDGKRTLKAIYIFTP